jgi:hypothetical protein
MNSKNTFPTETVKLASFPYSKKFYPDNPILSEGVIEIKYMGSKEEDILSNKNYIDKGIVLDKLLESVIITPGINIKDLILGDKNLLLVVTRILGLGKEYSFKYMGNQYSINLEDLNPKILNPELMNGIEGNEFKFILPHTETEITFKVLNGHDENRIEEEIKGIQKISPEADPDISVSLKHIITSVNGDRSQSTIRNFVDNNLLSRDSRALRKYMREVQPNIDLKFHTVDGGEAIIPLGIDFFWPEL